MGKFCDDVNEFFPPGFPEFQRGNELLKSTAEDYDPKARRTLHWRADSHLFAAGDIDS